MNVRRNVVTRAAGAVVLMAGGFGAGCSSTADAPSTQKGMAASPPKIAAAPKAQAPVALTPIAAQQVSENSVRQLVETYRRGYELTYLALATRARDLPAWKMAATANQPAGKLMLGLCTYYGLGEAANAEQGKSLILAAANAGHPEAMAVLSIILRNGTIQSRPDVDQANKWLGLALQRHSAIAADEVAIAAAKELLIDGKVTQAMDAYLAGARAGSLRAQVALAGIKRRAWLSQEDLPDSIRMLEAVAAQGHIGAMIQLGDIYSMSRYITPDYAKAKHWFDAAVATGDPRALYAAGCAYETGRTSADNRPDLEHAKLIWSTLAASSDPYAAFERYRARDTAGLAKTIDETAMRQFLFDAGTRGVPEAYTFVSLCYLHGDLNTEKDIARGIRLLDDGVAADDPSSVFQRACAYRFGYAGNPDEEKARPLYFAAARLGVPRAITSVALRYMSGRGVKLDPQVGHLCYLTAAREGDPEAMTTLAADYEAGRGTKRDAELAKLWATSAIRANQPDAYRTLFYLNGGHEFVNTHTQLSPEALGMLEQGMQAGSLACARDLGDLLIRGTSVKQDITRGLAILEKAAANDPYGESQRLLGDHYSAAGPGIVPADPQRAILLYEAAVKCGNADAWARLGVIHALGRGVEKDPARAMREFEKGFALGSSDCAYSIGRAYVEGDGVPKDIERGLKVLRIAADGGDSMSMSILAEYDLIIEGRPVNEAEGLAWAEKGAAFGEARCAWVAGQYFNYKKQDYAKAYSWLVRGVGMGDFGAMNNLGVLYRFGRGVPQDFKLAAQYYKRAAEGGLVGAMGNYAWCLENGNGVPVDKGEAFRWALNVAMAGDRAGMYHVGRMYFDGIGVAKDQQAGAAWLMKSAAAGEPDAIKIVAVMRAKGIIK